MKKELFFIPFAVCLVAHFIRLVYEILKYKKKLKPGKISFIIIFADMALLWVSWFALCGTDLLKIDLPCVVQYFGIILVAAGVIVFLTALFTIKTLESYDGNLITRGIYSKIRHPMYLGFILWLIGAPLFFEGLISFGLGILLIANVLFWRHLEETELEDRFPAYAEYREKTFF
jgi:protein-S-isoprenylcysteine O-methyltransferase Ste14